MRLTLRAEVVRVALVLAVIPAVGYVHVKQMERLLRDGQEQALLATARAIATALHDRPPPPAPPRPPRGPPPAPRPRPRPPPAGERRDGARAEEPLARGVAHLDRRPP